MHPLLAATTVNPEITSTAVGVFVLIAIQLSQFFFAYKKDGREGQAVLKSDLTDLKKELKQEVTQLALDVERLKKSFDDRMLSTQKENLRFQKDIHNRITAVATVTSALQKGLEVMEQRQISHDMKLDRLLSRHP